MIYQVQSTNLLGRGRTVSRQNRLGQNPSPRTSSGSGRPRPGSAATPLDPARRFSSTVTRWSSGIQVGFGPLLDTRREEKEKKNTGVLGIWKVQEETTYRQARWRGSVAWWSGGISRLSKREKHIFGTKGSPVQVGRGRDQSSWWMFHEAVLLRSISAGMRGREDKLDVKEYPHKREN